MLARRLLAGCAVLGCLVLTGEAELARHAPEPAAPGLPATGDSTAAVLDLETHPHLPPPTQAEQREILQGILADAARRHGLDPGLVMAVAWWESGWDMNQVSVTGAAGMMQVDPATVHDLGRKLLGRTPDVLNPYDNADLGAAVLAADIRDAGGHLDVALASYYEGAGNVDPANLDAGAQTYVEGVTSLQKRFDSGEVPW